MLKFSLKTILYNFKQTKKLYILKMWSTVISEQLENSFCCETDCVITSLITAAMLLCTMYISRKLFCHFKSSKIPVFKSIGNNDEVTAFTEKTAVEIETTKMCNEKNSANVPNAFHNLRILDGSKNTLNTKVSFDIQNCTSLGDQKLAASQTTEDIFTEYSPEINVSGIDSEVFLYSKNLATEKLTSTPKTAYSLTYDKTNTQNEELFRSSEIRRISPCKILHENVDSEFKFAQKMLTAEIFQGELTSSKTELSTVSKFFESDDLKVTKIGHSANSKIKKGSKQSVLKLVKLEARLQPDLNDSISNSREFLERSSCRQKVPLEMIYNILPINMK